MAAAEVMIRPVLARPPATASESATPVCHSSLIRDVFLKADRTGPILLLNDTDADDARKRLASLPFVVHDLVTFDYIELGDASPA